MLEIVMMATSAHIFYRMAEMEGSSGVLWAGLSVAAWIMASAYLGWLMFGGVLSQIVLFTGLTVWNCCCRGRRRPSAT